jgi:hypothetical protein
MSGADYYEIKKIIDDIVGDTQQGTVLLKAIRGYFTTKANIDEAGQIKVINYQGSKSPDKITSIKPTIHAINEEAQAAMDRYTKRLAVENAKFRKSNGRAKTCKTDS